MKKNVGFRKRIYSSTKFYPDAVESITDICREFPEGPTYSAVYQHIKAGHLDVAREHRLLISQKKELKQAEEQVAPIIQGDLQKAAGQILLESKDPYVRALDEYIRQGLEEVQSKRVKITAATFLAAIKIKADIEKGQKDRSADMVKAFAAMARKGSQGDS